MNGLGVMTWATGARYSGDFKNDMRNGYGLYIFENGNQYAG